MTTFLLCFTCWVMCALLGYMTHCESREHTNRRYSLPEPPTAPTVTIKPRLRIPAGEDPIE